MTDLEQVVARVREFNRFYTGRIGALKSGLLGTPYSLTQGRVIYEVGTQPGITSKQLCEILGIDTGYLSRLVKAFVQQGLVRREESKEDRRASHLSLTGKGRKVLAELNALSSKDVASMLAPLDVHARERLTGAMAAIRQTLAPAAAATAAAAPEIRIRQHRPGDIGWVVSRQGSYYAEEYGWDVTFEGLVAEIAGKFLNNFKPECERCWIAECYGERVGSIFLVRKSKHASQLRLLMVERSARGLGIGNRLVGECVAFARECGYRSIELWTNSLLHSARRIYQAHGFQLIEEKPHHSFGHDLIGQTWRLEL